VTIDKVLVLYGSAGGDVLLMGGLYCVLWGKKREEDRKSVTTDEQNTETKEKITLECITSHWVMECSCCMWISSIGFPVPTVRFWSRNIWIRKDHHPIGVSLYKDRVYGLYTGFCFFIFCFSFLAIMRIYFIMLRKVARNFWWFYWISAQFLKQMRF